MRGLTFALITGVLVIAPAGASALRETAAEPTGRIVFSTRFWPEDPGIVDNWELFATRLGTSGSVNLTRNPGCSEVLPAWSHSGQSIAYACNYGASSGIGLVPDSGGEGRRLIKLPRYSLEGGLAWSPDDRKIAFGRRGIWVMNADGSRPKRVTRKRDSSPTWSSDGRTIAFVRGARGSREIWLMRTNGTRQRRIAKGGSDTAWSPDGRRIAVLRNNGIWIMNPNGTGQRRVPGTGSASGLAWSPDSRYFAYQVSCCVEAGIYVVATNGGGRRFVAGALEPQGLTWGIDPS